ncbi:MAG: hypothetical protein IT381_13690 [Deltaproteobacteria bacterium]|nr:hypothetical protein [Deltaproteobacteria bacterium]
MLLYKPFRAGERKRLAQAPPKRPQRPGQRQGGPPVRAPRPPRDPHRTKLIDKDAWGYNFAQPIWKLDASSERMKRAPEDRERERVLLMLAREFELGPDDLHNGLSAEMITWGLFRNEKISPRKTFAEALRTACLKARGGRLGIFQTHFLAHKLALMQTVRVKSPAFGFPLELDVQNVVMLEKYEVGYVVHLDRVFYPVFALPKISRFVEPALLADAYRLLDGRGESVVRSPKKEPLFTITGDPHHDPEKPFEWSVVQKDRALTLKEPFGRTPAATLTDASGKIVASIDSQHGPDAHVIDVTLRVDLPGDLKPWIGFLAVYLDAFVQRSLGILGRAREAVAAKEKAEQEEDE